MKITKVLLAVFFSASTFYFGCKPKDSDVQANVTEKFAATPECTGASATVTDGVATLTGEVKDDMCKNTAEKTAKDVKGVKSVVDNLTVTPAVAAPAAPITAPDDTLTQGVKDATKDFPTVTAAVNSGEITLTGNIKRADLQRLMQSLNSLHPTKINNQLTIK
ncbi:MAG: BON domain-containing protein [Bacteroidota bacterium]|nr:BON domain-containing protein [Bacteroidota bacterium]